MLYNTLYGVHHATLHWNIALYIVLQQHQRLLQRALCIRSSEAKCNFAPLNTAALQLWQHLTAVHHLIVKLLGKASLALQLFAFYSAQMCKDVQPYTAMQICTKCKTVHLGELGRDLRWATVRLGAKKQSNLVLLHHCTVPSACTST